MSLDRIVPLSLVLLISPVAAIAQDAAVNPQKIGDKTVARAATAPPTENWSAFNDLKTGLHLAASVVVQHEERHDFVREIVRVQWRISDPIDLWIVRPIAPGKVPAVLYLYSYSDVNDRFHDDGWCQRAVSEGFAAVGFVSALTDYRFKNRPMKQWFVSELPEALGSSVHDVQFILNYLTERGDMDIERVGMFGMGSGATIAILAAHADSRIKSIDLLDPWGDWPNWLEFSPAVPDAERPKYITADFLKSVASFDPVVYLPSLKTQSFRVQQTLTEPVTPKIAKERIAAAVKDPTRVVQYANAKDLFKAWQTSGLSGWIKRQLLSERLKQVASAAE